MVIFIICIKCGLSKNNHSKGMCKKCYHRNDYLKHIDERLIYASKYSKDHPEQTKIYSKNAYRRDKLIVLKMCGGIKCINCGQIDVRILELNYIGGGHAKLIREKKISYGASLLRDIINGKTDKKLFNIMCKVCNNAEVCSRLYGLKYKIIPQKY